MHLRAETEAGSEGVGCSASVQSSPCTPGDSGLREREAAAAALHGVEQRARGAGRVAEGGLFEALRLLTAGEERSAAAFASAASSSEAAGPVGGGSSSVSPLLALATDELMLAFLSSSATSDLASLFEQQTSAESLREIIARETARVEESVALTLEGLSRTLGTLGERPPATPQTFLSAKGLEESASGDEGLRSGESFETCDEARAEDVNDAPAARVEEATLEEQGLAVEFGKDGGAKKALHFTSPKKPSLVSGKKKKQSTLADGGASSQPGRNAQDLSLLLSTIKGLAKQRALRPPTAEESLDAETEAALEAAFSDCPDGVMNDTRVFGERVVVPLLGLGVYMTKTLFQRIAGGDALQQRGLSLSRLKDFWKGRFVLKTRDPSLNEEFPLPPLPEYPAPPAGLEEEFASQWRFSPERPQLWRGSILNFLGAVASAETPDRIYPKDFEPWVQEVVDSAPDMNFLRSPDNAEFVGKFVESVVARIMFYVDFESKGYIQLKDLRRSSLTHVWASLHPGVELSAVRHFFSYDHFYVLYTAFNQLVDDEDSMVESSNAAKYQGFSISGLVESRIFSQVVHRLQSAVPNRLTFADWIWFVLLYHEVTNPKAIALWFEILDLNGDGFIDESEVRAFYEAQAERLETPPSRPCAYKDFLCQAFDALGIYPGRPLMLRDLLREPTAAAMFISCLAKREYFCAFEEGDSVIAYVAGQPSERRLFTEFSPFDLFAQAEYAFMTTQRTHEPEVANWGEAEEEGEEGDEDDFPHEVILG